jgi:hypothetical protein
MKTLSKTMLTAIALILSLSSVAQATELVTPHLPYFDFISGSENVRKSCMAMNATSAARQITVEIFAPGLATPSAANSLTVSPGNGIGAHLSGINATGFHYCRITFPGGKKSVRGVLYVELEGVPTGTVQAE